MTKKTLTLLLFPFLLLALACNPQKKMAKKKRTYMESAYAALKNAVNEAEVSILNDTVKVLFPEHLLFQKNSAEINKETYPLMQRFARALNMYPGTKILINGYTDKTGEDALNRKLSKNRAEATKTLLGSDKVNSDRMLTWGMGDDNPLASNDTEEGRRKNRRVEFIVLYNYDTAQ